ncbi:hypothetical protein P691DRAFT_690255 [Macrolepiota fuliginosa MF-IS2]|uniref:Uncharacterized protein n=1 Tax=Macrolepiota fuliginosa MF-IS2 TaxID=1400762 RepID=A0A9P5WXB9_9AGAR|nr:hypothetical protein P691DRAFT_690255 [Macrolepiota fuliginosa MF-IS2]
MGYGGWILVTTTVASQANLEVIRLGFKAASPPGTKFYPCLPQSKSYLKVIDIPFFKTLPYASVNAKGVTEHHPATYIVEGDVRAAFAQSPLAPHLNLVDKPRIVRTSRASDMCTTWFKIWDSQQGTSAQYLVGCTIMVNGVGSPIYAAKVNQGKSLCQKCWHWGHPTNMCRHLGYICPVCGGPHQRDHHRMLCGPHKGNPKANPPMPHLLRRRLTLIIWTTWTMPWTRLLTTLRWLCVRRTQVCRCMATSRQFQLPRFMWGVHWSM